MKFFTSLLSLWIAVVSFSAWSQDQIIEKVFSSKPADYRHQLEILDTIPFEYSNWNDYYYYYTEASFGLEDFQFFLTYRNKNTGKTGLIVYGTDKNYFTEPVADSIYFLTVKEVQTNEFYDEEGNYFSNSVASSLYFYFDHKSGQDELWTLTCDGTSYSASKTGNVQRDLFKAVSFTENLDEYGGSYVTAIYANLRTNEIVNSEVINEKVTYQEVYSYHYDDYYYGEYDYYYSYETPDVDYSIPYFETRLNYEPIEITYIMEGGRISEVVNYEYPESNLNSYYVKAVPDEFSGVWKSDLTAEVPGMFILDGDDFWTSYGNFFATVDTYSELYAVGQGSFEDAKSKLGLSSDVVKKIESSWKGGKSDVKFIGFTSFTGNSRYKDYFVFNNDIMAHAYLELNESGEAVSGVEYLLPQKIYENFGMAAYDPYMYNTTITDKNGKQMDIYNHGVGYYYNYNLSVSEDNVNAEGDLVLTTQSIASINFKSYASGNNYLGKVRVQWIGNQDLSGSAEVVGLKSMPFRILDESGAVISDDVFYMYAVNVQGFNLLQVTDSKNKTGVIGPDGKWMLKQEWDAVSIMGPSSGYYYETISFPFFFIVTLGEEYGAMNSKGEWVIPMGGYDYIEVCSDKLLATKDSKLTVFSFDGKKLIENIDGVADYYYGYATDCYSFDSYAYNGYRAIVKDEKYGIADKNFNMVVPFKYASITSLSGDNYLALDENSMYGIINTKNEIVLPFEFESIYTFDYNYTRFIATKNGKQGVIDATGKVLIPFEYYSISGSSDWESNIIMVSDPEYRTNIIDTTGRPIISDNCTYVYYYYSTNMIYCSNDNVYSFYDVSGKMLYSKVAYYIDPYYAYDNVQVIQQGDWDNPKFGAFDLYTGEDIMPCEFESLYPFWIGDYMFFAGYKKGKIGIYSYDGTELVKPKGAYLDDYYYDDGYYGGEPGYYVQISNKKGKTKLIRLDW